MENSLSNIQGALYNFEKDLNVCSAMLGPDHHSTFKAQGNVTRCKKEIEKITGLKKNAYQKMRPKDIEEKLRTIKGGEDNPGEGNSSAGTKKEKLIKELLEEEKKKLKQKIEDGKGLDEFGPRGSYGIRDYFSY